MAIELIKRKADVNTQDREGDVALTMACWFHPFLMKELIWAGANPYIENNQGLDVFAFAKKKNLKGYKELKSITQEVDLRKRFTYKALNKKRKVL